MLIMLNIVWLIVLFKKKTKNMCCFTLLFFFWDKVCVPWATLKLLISLGAKVGRLQACTTTSGWEVSPFEDRVSWSPGWVPRWRWPWTPSPPKWWDYRDMAPCSTEKSFLWILSTFGYKDIVPIWEGKKSPLPIRGKIAYLEGHLKFRKLSVAEKYKAKSLSDTVVPHPSTKDHWITSTMLVSMHGNSVTILARQKIFQRDTLGPLLS